MKRLIQLTAVAALTLSLNSCGLPAAVGRTVGNAASGVGALAGKAMTTGL